MTIASTGIDLQSVSCATGSSCVAVAADGYILTYGNGVWSAPRRLNGEPLAVACPSVSICVADGSNNPFHPTRGTIWRLSGGSVRRQWTFGPNQFGSIDCASASFCVAGDNSGGAYAYNGRFWSGADLVYRGGSVASVSCPAVGFCMAVGLSDALVDRDGSWTRPRRVDRHQALYSVSCSSPSFCMAVDNAGHAVKYQGT